MAPLSSDPRQILVALNVARRKALYSLVTEITTYMRSQLELSDDAPEENPPPLPARKSSGNISTTGRTATDNAPLFLPRTNSADSQKQREEEQQQQQQRRDPPPPELIKLRKAALKHFDSWRHEVLGKLKEIVDAPDDQKVLDARRKRDALIAKKQAEQPAKGEDLMSFADKAPEADDDTAPQKMESMQHLYHPIPTRLTTIPLFDRKDVTSSMLILLLSIGNYSAYSRALICYLASALEVSPLFLDQEEVEIATTMVETAQKAEEEKKKGGSSMSADAEAQKRKESGQVGRFWKVGLASVAGAAIIGVTGGLAAPLVAGAVGGLMGSVGLGGLASFLGLFWMNAALVGTIFGAYGAKMTGEMIDRYAKEVDDFRFLPLAEEWGEHTKKDTAAARRLRVTIGINGWLREEGDVTRYWRPLGDETEVFALRYEMQSLLALGVTLEELIASYAWKAIKSEILKRTVLATLWGALWPIHLVMMASKVDNPFSLARNRSEKAGKILADALINKVQGERPVTLIGYSLGARVIYCCLREMAERKAFGLIDTVVLIGAPVPSNPGHWQMMRTVVSGKLFNVYSENDYILAFLYRTTSAQLGIAGLQPISDEVTGVENLNLSEEVEGHLRYPELIPKILNRCGFLDVKGGDGAIPKEEDDNIQLHNKDYGETGNLLDIDDENQKKKILSPSKHTLEDMANEKFDPTVKNSLEQKSDKGAKDAKLMGGKIAEEHKAAAKSPSPLPEANDPMTTRNAGVELRQAPGSGTKADVPPPQYTKAEEGRHDEYSDDDDYTGGIQMHDRDERSDAGDLVTVEPLSLEERH